MAAKQHSCAMLWLFEAASAVVLQVAGNPIGSSSPKQGSLYVGPFEPLNLFFVVGLQVPIGGLTPYPSDKTISQVLAAICTFDLLMHDTDLLISAPAACLV